MPNDLLAYLYQGATYYSSVKTDYFDVEPIIQRIKKDITQNSWMGFNFPVKVSDLQYKFAKQSNDFNKYYDQQELITDERISNDASLNLYANGRPWKTRKVLTGSYYYSYYEDQDYFDPNTNISEIWYLLKLKEAGLGKSSYLIEAFVKSFSDFTKNVQKSSDNDVYLTNGNLMINIYTNTSGNVCILIKKAY